MGVNPPTGAAITPKIRDAARADLPAIVEIYNEAVVNTVATFDTKPKTVTDQAAWFEAHGGRHPILVAEVDGRVVGWSSLSAWSDRCAYADTVEISTYVAPAWRGQGIGKALKIALLARAKVHGHHSVLSRVAGDNEASNALNDKLGFKRIGTMREVGRKFGKLHDVHLYQLMLADFCLVNQTCSESTAPGTSSP